MLVAPFLLVLNVALGGCKGSEERSMFKINCQNTSERVMCGKKMETLVWWVEDTKCCLKNAYCIARP